MIAPARPMASVATGTPAGIWTMDRSESTPRSAFDSTGTPRTGSGVFAAVMPGRCAAPPAPAMITPRPRPAADSAYSNRKSGVRCAETTRDLVRHAQHLERRAAWAIVSQSDREPMITPTRGRAPFRFFAIGSLRAVVYRGMGALLIVAAAVAWGTTGATMKLVAATGSPISPLAVGFLRVAIAAPCLCLAARWLGGSGPWPARADRGRFLLAGLAMGVYQPFYFWGVAMTSVAVGSLIAICSAPLFITVLAALFLGERIDRRTWTALLAGIAGTALLTIGPHGLSKLPRASSSAWDSSSSPASATRPTRSP